jgi:hypothetical protein
MTGIPDVVSGELRDAAAAHDHDCGKEFGGGPRIRRDAHD